MWRKTLLTLFVGFAPLVGFMPAQQPRVDNLENTNILRNKIVALLGLKSTSAEYIKFRKEHQLFVSKEEKRLVHFVKNKHYSYETVTYEGGSGFYFEIVTRTQRQLPEDREIVYNEPTLRRAVLLLNEFEESSEFGVWKSDPGWLERTMLTPEDCLKRWPDPNLDVTTRKFSGKFEDGKRRELIYGGANPRNANKPYGFVFHNDLLCKLILLRSGPLITVPVQKLGPK